MSTIKGRTTEAAKIRRYNNVRQCVLARKKVPEESFIIFILIDVFVVVVVAVVVLVISVFVFTLVPVSIFLLTRGIAKIIVFVSTSSITISFQSLCSQNLSK